MENNGSCLSMSASAGSNEMLPCWLGDFPSHSSFLALRSPFLIPQSRQLSQCWSKLRTAEGLPSQGLRWQYVRWQRAVCSLGNEKLTCSFLFSAALLSAETVGISMEGFIFPLNGQQGQSLDFQVKGMPQNIWPMWLFWKARWGEGVRLAVMDFSPWRPEVTGSNSSPDALSGLI